MPKAATTPTSGTAPVNPKKAWTSLLICAAIAGYIGFIQVPSCIRDNEARQAAAAAEAEEVARRGPRPIPSEWDAVCPEVLAYLNRTLLDAGSLEIVEASPVVPFEDNAWAQRVRYRARNGFGAYMLAEKVFVIQNSDVVDLFDSDGSSNERPQRRHDVEDLYRKLRGRP